MKPKRTLRLHNTAHNFLTLSLQRLPCTVNIPMHGARIFATPVARVCDLIKQPDLLLGPSVVVVVFTTWRRVVVIMNPLHDTVGDTPSSIRHSTRKKLSTMNDEIIIKNPCLLNFCGYQIFAQNWKFMKIYFY